MAAPLHQPFNYSPLRQAGLHQYIPYRRILAKLRLGIRAQGHDLGLGFARPGHQRIQQLAAYALAGEGGVDVGVVDDDQRGVGPAVGHLGEVAALGAGDEEGAFGVGFLVLNGVGHLPDSAGVSRIPTHRLADRRPHRARPGQCGA